MLEKGEEKHPGKEGHKDMSHQSCGPTAQKKHRDSGKVGGGGKKRVLGIERSAGNGIGIPGLACVCGDM